MSEATKYAIEAADNLNACGYLYLGIRGREKPIEGAVRIIEQAIQRAMEHRCFTWTTSDANAAALCPDFTKVLQVNPSGDTPPLPISDELRPAAEVAAECRYIADLIERAEEVGMVHECIPAEAATDVEIVREYLEDEMP